MGKEPHAYKCRHEKSRAPCWLVWVLPIFPTRREARELPGLPAQALARLQRSLLCSFTFLYFPLICQDFFLPFLVF